MSTFKLPDLGEGLAEAEIVEWHVKVGDHVRVDQPMVSVETAKAVVEVPAPFSGVVTALRGAARRHRAHRSAAHRVRFRHRRRQHAGDERGGIRRAELGWRRAQRTKSAAARRAVPAARALAKRLGVDLAVVQGSGRAGLITLDDVLQNANMSIAIGRRARLAGRACNCGRRARRRHRRAVARRAARDGAQHVAVARSGVRAARCATTPTSTAGRKRGDYMLRLMRAMICAWRAEPALNAWYDPIAQSRILVAHIDLAIAVDTPGGLIVPVVRNIENKSPDELRAAIALQKAAAHQRSTQPEDLRDFTLMLSNFGTLAGRYGIPLVVPPAVAILGAGKVREDAVVVAGAVQAHRRMPLSLSFDHRCITGGEACRFLAAVIADLEKPD